MSYRMLYFIYLFVISAFVLGIVAAAYHIENEEHDHFSNYHYSNTKGVYSKNNDELLLKLKRKIVKLNEMEKQDPSKITIIEKEKKEIGIYIKALEAAK